MVSQAALLPRGDLGVDRGGPGYPLLFEILYSFIEFPEKISIYIAGKWTLPSVPATPFWIFCIRPCLQLSAYYRKTGNVS